MPLGLGDLATMLTTAPTERAKPVDGDLNDGCVAKLPCHPSPKDAIKRITPQTLVEVLRGKYHRPEHVLVIDCRYGYEFDGGHILDAHNVTSMEQAERLLFWPPPSEHRCLIFHCEFSSERAPRLALNVRHRDRALNEGRYPFLHYPEMYILEGGYAAFVEAFPAAVAPPGGYTPMASERHRDELAQCRRQRRTWTLGPAGKPVKRARIDDHFPHRHPNHRSNSSNGNEGGPRCDKALSQRLRSASQDSRLYRQHSPSTAMRFSHSQPVGHESDGDDYGGGMDDELASNTGCTQDMARLLTSVHDFECPLHEEVLSSCMY